MFSDPRRDAHRFADALRAAVADGRARDHRKFRAWAAKVDARPRPKGDPLAPRKRGRSNAEKGGRAAADEQALVAQIRRAPGAVLHTLSCAHPAGLHAADPCEVSCRIHTKKEECMPATAWLLRGARTHTGAPSGPSAAKPGCWRHVPHVCKAAAGAARMHCQPANAPKTLTGPARQGPSDRRAGRGRAAGIARGALLRQGSSQSGQERGPARRAPRGGLCRHARFGACARRRRARKRRPAHQEARKDLTARHLRAEAYVACGPRALWTRLLLCWVCGGLGRWSARCGRLGGTARWREAHVECGSS